MFFKIVVLKISQISQESTCVGVFFNKVAGPQKEAPVKFVKFLRTPYFTEHSQRLLLIVSGFQLATLLKKKFRQRCFLRTKFLRTSFDRTPPDDCFLCLSVNFEKFLRKPLL